MKTEKHPHARDYISSLAARGRYHFGSQESQKALGVSADATKLALNRLARQGLIASPSRGFYVIVPPEYRSLGCLPAEQFIPALMTRLSLPYYIGLLSAAQYHGAAHHSPQVTQVMVANSRRPLSCGAVRVAFFVRGKIAAIPVQSFNTPRGVAMVSTPEATAVDLVGYHDRVGGFDQVATILEELAEKINPEKLVAAAQTAPMPWAQRLGYLLELVEAGDKANPLKSHVRQHANQTVTMLPSAAQKTLTTSKDWKLIVNVAVEPEL